MATTEGCGSVWRSDIVNIYAHSPATIFQWTGYSRPSEGRKLSGYEEAGSAATSTTQSLYVVLQKALA